ncbi:MULTISPECIES: VOC family protein [unclassified Lysobacter]|uniref:VOC family protein n=1 Tax=unclassified Lysobacter TaxID=2635362 RepID=UPI001C2439AC|nr:VOC family protein [Lysobacter sp. MMG2]MBU8977039.1 VOC family protein [Lysobacter sp. MMG2]
MSTRELFAYLCVPDADAAVAFYREVFDAQETLRLVDSGGRVGHVEVTLAGTTLMLCEPYPEYGIAPPQASAPSCVTLHVHVDDADAVIARALARGGELVMPARDQFYGERSGVVRDPAGHRWNIGHSIEDVTAQEMQRRFVALTEPC